MKKIESLEELRKDIDEIDLKILDLIQKRKDLVTEEDLREELQKNAPSVQSGLFLVPKVIEGED